MGLLLGLGLGQAIIDRYYFATFLGPGGVCVVNGVEIEIGDSFPAEDGCNTWYVLSDDYTQLALCSK